MSGYTGSDKDQKVGLVHRGEFWAPCSCGGHVHAFEDGEVVGHTLPINIKEDHRVSYGPPLFWGYKLVT